MCVYVCPLRSLYSLYSLPHDLCSNIHARATTRIRVSSAHLPRQVEQTTGSIPQASISDLKKKIDNMKEELNTERSKLTSSFGDLHSMTFSQLVILHIELKNKIQALEAEVEAKVKAKAQLKRR